MFYIHACKERVNFLFNARNLECIIPFFSFTDFCTIILYPMHIFKIQVFYEELSHTCALTPNPVCAAAAVGCCCSLLSAVCVACGSHHSSHHRASINLQSQSIERHAHTHSTLMLTSFVQAKFWLSNVDLPIFLELNISVYDTSFLLTDTDTDTHHHFIWRRMTEFKKEAPFCTFKRRRWPFFTSPFLYIISILTLYPNQ